MAVSLLVSLSLTPTLCARLLRVRAADDDNPVQRLGSLVFNSLREGYVRTLRSSLRRLPLVLVLFAGVIGLNVWLFNKVPKGIVPQQDTAQLRGFARGDDLSLIHI